MHNLCNPLTRTIALANGPEVTIKLFANNKPYVMSIVQGETLPLERTQFPEQQKKVKSTIKQQNNSKQ